MNVKHIEVGLNSNIGLRRKDNQDSACAGNGVYVVCDGMGGGKGGKQASSDVAERFARLAELPTRDLDAIDETLILAQQEVLRLGEQLGGVAGTTISGVLLQPVTAPDAPDNPPWRNLALGLGLALVLGLVVVVAKLTGKVPVPGYAALMVAMTFFAGLNALGLGLIGSYAWRAYENSKQRPLALVLKQHDFCGEDANGR